MKKIAKTITAIAAVVATIGLAPLSASAFGGACPPPTERHYNRMGTELGLTDKQKQDIQEICTKSRTQNEPLIKQMATEKRALRTLIHADSVDEAAIRAQSGKMAAIMANLAVQHAQTARQVRALLTPKQAQKLKEIQAKRDSRMDDMGYCGARHRRQHR
jgi:Spy/CpxP family protein refolding chaperone